MCNSVKRSDVTGHRFEWQLVGILHCINQLGENIGGQGYWVSHNILKDHWYDVTCQIMEYIVSNRSYINLFWIKIKIRKRFIFYNFFKWQIILYIRSAIGGGVF